MPEVVEQNQMINDFGAMVTIMCIMLHAPIIHVAAEDKIRMKLMVLILLLKTSCAWSQTFALEKISGPQGPLGPGALGG